MKIDPYKHDERWQAWKEKFKLGIPGISQINSGFAFLYTLGSLALVLYALQINDRIFVALNGFALLMSAIGLFYTIRPNNKRKY